MTTLQKPDGKIRADMRETITVTLEQLILEGNTLDDTEYHREMRRIAEQPTDTPDDKDFTQDEVRWWSKGLKRGKRQAQTELPMKYYN